MNLRILYRRHRDISLLFRGEVRGELSYLAPLGSEKISAPYFKQCFFRGGGVLPPRLSQRRLLFDRVGVFMADIIFTLLSLLFCL